MHPRPHSADDHQVTGWTVWRRIFGWSAAGTVLIFIAQLASPRSGFLDMRTVVAIGQSMFLFGGLCLWRLVEVLCNPRFAHLWRGHAWLLGLGTLVAAPPLFVLIGFSAR